MSSSKVATLKIVKKREKNHGFFNIFKKADFKGLMQKCEKSSKKHGRTTTQKKRGSWVPPGLILGHFLVLLGASWRFWGALGASWGALGVLLGCSWGALGALLELVLALGPLWDEFWVDFGLILAIFNRL